MRFFKVYLRLTGKQNLFNIKAYYGENMNKNQNFIIALLAIITMVLVGCGEAYKGDFTEQQICKAVISSIMGREPSIIRIDSVQENTSYLSYNRPSDDSHWKYRCTLKGNKAIWATDTGRWHTHQDDSVITFSVIVDELNIFEKYSDGSSDVDKYTLDQLSE